jgi:lipoprotein signal peptidase
MDPGRETGRAVCFFPSGRASDSPRTEVGYVQVTSVPAVDSRAALLRLAVLVTVAVLLADVATKNWALAVVGSGYVDLGLVALTVVENEALAFSVGTGVLAPTTVVALRLGALAALLILAWRFGPASLRFALGFALVIGGGLGNASDVVLRNGAVVDFISTAPLTRGPLSGTSVEGVVMNLADVWVLAGLFLLYPLFRALGVAVQRRLVRFEERILGSGGPAGIPVEVTHLPAPRSTGSTRS